VQTGIGEERRGVVEGGQPLVRIVEYYRTAGSARPREHVGEEPRIAA
jgi:hypothetical protein